MIRKFLLAITVVTLSGCAGQTFSVPIPTSGRDKNGNKTTSVRSAPIFKNTGNLTNVKYAYSGVGGSVRFSADLIDNASATKALHDGIQGDIHQAGSALFKTVAVGATGGFLGSAAGAAKAFAP